MRRLKVALKRKKLTKLINSQEMSLLRIAEQYPDEYILVKIIETDDKTGRTRGIALFISPSYAKLCRIKKGLDVEKFIIIQGENMYSMFSRVI